jgi:hypothetical protein
MKQIPRLLGKAVEDANPVTKILLQDVIKLQEILNGTNKDFLIFDNKGGSKFEVVVNRIAQDSNTGEEVKEYVKDFIEWMLENNKEWIFCYQLDNNEHILRDISTQQLVANKH